jgi:hypothetical protein
VAADGVHFTAGAEMSVHNLGGFGARLYGSWNGYDFNQTYAVGDLPEFDAGGELSFRHKDVFSVRFGAELIGERKYIMGNGMWPSDVSGDIPLQADWTIGTIEPAVDIFAAAEVRVASDLWVWIEGRNLAGQALYPQPCYRGLGANVMGGVKILF